MRFVLLRFFIAFTCFFFISGPLTAQNGFTTGLNGTVINLPCGQNCVSQVFKIPHIKGTSDYAVNSISYKPYAYVTPGGTEDLNLYNDDRYGTVFDLPFPFCFYDSLFTKVSVSSNGLITFDYGLLACPANMQAAYDVTNSIPFDPLSGTCSGGSNNYPKAAIMGVFQDLDPRPGPASATVSSPADRKIEWRVEGTAPFRRFIVSYYKIGVYQATTCGLSTPAIFQIVIYESTAVIEVFIENKLCSANGGNGGKAILGIQNWNRDLGKAAPGKNAVSWTASQEGYRFTPSGSGSRFVSCQLETLAGLPVATGDTVTTTAGLLDVTFQNFCQSAISGQYVIKTIYSACDNVGTQVEIRDTITVNKTTALNATATATQTACGATGTGTSTVTVPPGVGTAPYSFVLNPSGVTLTGSSPQQFATLAAGTYSIVVTDASGGCSSTVPITITSTGSLNVTYTVTNTTCPGASNGTITVNPPNGTLPITYSINSGLYTTNNVFTNLVAGTYFLFTHDAAGCVKDFDPVTVGQGTGTVTGTATPTPTTCAGVNNGSIQVQPTSGVGPYQYSINGGTTWQTNNTFAGLAPGSYNALIREGGACISAPIPAAITAGSGIQAGITFSPTTCTGVNNGSIQVTPTTGTAPYTFVLDGTTSQSGATANFTGVSAGSHGVTITDASGCIAAPPLTTTVTTGAGFTANYTSTNSACTGATNGTITVTPGTGGTGPYTFVLGTTSQTGATNTTFTGLASGSYNILITDANGCQFNLTNAVVNASTGFIATYSSSNSTCTGATNGSLTVTPGTGGTGPYSFVLGTISQTGATNTTFTGLASGSYNVLITDANGCQFTLTNAVVNASTGFIATYTSSNSTCTGATNGSLTVTPGTGGTGPYTFVLGTISQTGAVNTTFTGLASGSYSVLITDANGCQFTLANAVVNASTGFIATYTSSNSTCTGATNGSLTVIPGTGGTGPYTFVLGTTSQAGATNTTFTGLASGSYSLLITDANGCQFTLTNAIVNAGAGFTATYTSTNTSCTGAANGSLAVTPGNGGTSPYSFVLGTASQTGAASTIFTGLASGTHNVLITDANGCQYTLTNAVVPAGPPLNVPLSLSNTTCPGVNNGSVIATPANGTGPYTFVLDGTVTQTGTITSSFTGLTSGIHTLLVTDQNGCSVNIPPFNIGSGAGITANIIPTGTSCTGAMNGSISVAPTNGTAPYSFVLNSATTQVGVTNTAFLNLPAGNGYSILITDAVGCTGLFNNINVPQGSALLVNTVPTNTSCNGASNGQIIVTPTNGGGPYTFVLNGTVAQTGATNTTFIGLAASTYNIVITDAAGCATGPVPTTINEGPAITVSPAKADATCFGSSTGSITASASANVTAPVEFSLDGTTWQTSPSFIGLPANSYTVYVHDGAGCANTAAIVIDQPGQLIVTPSVQSVTCNGLGDGKITINASGGTPAYSYSLDNITFQPGNLFTRPAGPYTVYVKDANNCPSTGNNIVVNEPAILTATAVTGNATCDGGNDGTIDITASGGTSPYQFALAGSAFQASGILKSGPGTYDVSVKDANGCQYQVTGAVVGLTNNLTLTPANNPSAICEGDSVRLQLTTNATGFAWLPVSGLSNSSIANPMASPKDTTQYSVTVTLGRCTLTDDLVVTIIPAPIPDAGLPGDICFGQSYQLKPLGDPSYTYSWSPSTYLNNATGFTVISTPEKPITYSLKVTDNNGCTSVITDNVAVNVTPPIKVTTFPADTVVIAGAKIPLLAVSAGTSYIWSPATGLSNDTVANPIATASLFDGDSVIYKVTTYNSAGCTGDAYVTIKVYKGPDIYVPNAFTPNGDGKNDLFFAFPVGIKQLNYFRVFNRWGQMLYSTTTLYEGWDGKLAGRDQATGVYIWIAEGITADGKKITKKGTIALIR